MSKKKTKFAFFTVPEYEEEGKWLREQHKKGWKLINATAPGFYRFEECEPEDVVYQLDYNQEGMQHKDEYIQMFQDCGWEYITDMVGYSYFRKSVSEMKEEEEIFSDEESKKDMIQRVYRGRMLPLLAIFFCILIPQYIQRMHSGDIAIAVVFAILFILYVLIFIKFARKYWKLKKK